MIKSFSFVRDFRGKNEKNEERSFRKFVRKQKMFS